MQFVFYVTTLFHFSGSLVIRLVTFIAALSFFNFVLEFLQNNLEYTSHADSFTFLSQISSLLAKSFFMGFSLTILSLLARLRVLVQQVGVCNRGWLHFS